jgi:hypothetical protein|tara:strand:+ start:45 stop:431 length:387 start_codon:yes stop_codon:yes gene_type:complete
MKAHFKTQLEATVSGYFNGNKFIRTVALLEDLVFYTKAGDSITVPAGFESDGASVPKLFWSAFPPFDTYLPAAVVHDILCVQGHNDKCLYTSIEAADIFYEAMRACGVGITKARMMYYAVRYFGPKWK